MPSFADHPGRASALGGTLTASLERNPYVLVVGCPRSGTTLLQRMLDSHPRLAVANDTHFITRALQKMAHQGSDSVLCGNDIPFTGELVERVLTYHRFGRLGLSGSAVGEAAAKSRTYREFVSALYTQFGLLRDKPLAGEKTPDYVRCLPMLHALLPWVRTVHIIRDGRDVALSMTEWAKDGKGPAKLDRWQDEPTAVCALWWRWHVSAGRNDGRRLGPAAYCEVAYEDLVADSERELRRVATFLDLPFAPEMLAYHAVKTGSRPDRPGKRAALPPTLGLRDWRTQMREREVALFEALAGETLVELGYERAVETIPPATRALAQSYADWWQTCAVAPTTSRADGDVPSA